MYLSIWLVTATLILGGSASPTRSTSGDKVARACAPLSSPTKPYTIVAIAPNTAIHQMTMNLGANHQIILGGEPLVPPCPQSENNKCAPGAYSVWDGFGSLVSYYTQPHPSTQLHSLTIASSMYKFLAVRRHTLVLLERSVLPPPRRTLCLRVPNSTHLLMTNQINATRHTVSSAPKFSVRKV